MGKVPIWTTKDKQRIPVTKMSDSHVQNTHRMMAGAIETMDSLLDEEMLDGYLDRMWAAIRWLQVFHDECCLRKINRLRSGPPIRNEGHVREPVWDEDMRLSEILDGDIVFLEYDLRSAGIAVIGMLCSTEPNGDAAQDAFWGEFHYANKMSVLAGRWLSVFQGEANRRGLELRES